jgi:hypothetical protein
MRIIIILGFVLVLLLPVVADAGHEHPERWYQERWCAEKGGAVEVVLSDRTRCDCLTDENAVEFDFGTKWAEAIGQALYYSIQTGKRALSGVDPRKINRSEVLDSVKLGDSTFWVAD